MAIEKIKSFLRVLSGKEAQRIRALNTIEGRNDYREILKLEELEWKNFPYLIGEYRSGRLDPSWDLTLTGIPLKRLKDVEKRNLVTRGLFYPMLRGLDVAHESPEACYFYNEKKGLVPLIPIDGFEDGEYRAKRIIDSYIIHRKGFERAIEEIEEVSAEKLRSGREHEFVDSLRDKYGLSW